MSQEQIPFKTSYTILRWKEILVSSGFSSTLHLCWNLQQTSIARLCKPVFYDAANEGAASTWLVCVGWSCCTGGRGSWDGGGLSNTATCKRESKSSRGLRQRKDSTRSKRPLSETHVRDMRGDFERQHLGKKTHMMIEIGRSRGRATSVAPKLEKNISHLADEERLSGEACLSVSGAKTDPSQALLSPLFKKR